MRQDKGIKNTLVSGSKACTGNIALTEMGQNICGADVKMLEVIAAMPPNYRLR